MSHPFSCATLRSKSGLTNGMTQKILRSFTIGHSFRRRTIRVDYTTNCLSEAPNTHSRPIHKTFKFKIFCVIQLKAWKSSQISRLIGTSGYLCCSSNSSQNIIL